MTSNFWKHGMIYARFFKRTMNYLNMSYTRYKYKRYYPTNKSSDTPASGYYTFANDNNGMFEKEESLSDYQTRADFTAFRLYYEFSDANNVKLGNISNTYYEFQLRETEAGNPFVEAWVLDPAARSRRARHAHRRRRAAGSVRRRPAHRGTLQATATAATSTGGAADSRPRPPCSPARRPDAARPVHWMTRGEAPCAHVTLAALIALRRDAGDAHAELRERRRRRRRVRSGSLAGPRRRLRRCGSCIRSATGS
jgi:hypothetical protein